MLKRKKRSQKLLIFLLLNQYIVAWSQKEECGLKYVIHNQVNRSGLRLNTLTLSNIIMQV